MEIGIVPDAIRLARAAMPNAKPIGTLARKQTTRVTTKAVSIDQFPSLTRLFQIKKVSIIQYIISNTPITGTEIYIQLMGIPIAGEACLLVI
jgi:hypothetical protein